MKEYKRTVVTPTHGVSNSPSDLVCDDERLSVCEGLKVQDGELKPIQHPAKMSMVVPGKLEFIHDYNGMKRFLYSTVTDDVTTLGYTYEGNRTDIVALRDSDNHLGAKVVNGSINSDVSIVLRYFGQVEHPAINPIAFAKRVYGSSESNPNLHRKNTASTDIVASYKFGWYREGVNVYADDDNSKVEICFGAEFIIDEPTITLTLTDGETDATLSLTLSDFTEFTLNDETCYYYDYSSEYSGYYFKDISFGYAYYTVPYSTESELTSDRQSSVYETMIFFSMASDSTEGTLLDYTYSPSASLTLQEALYSLRTKHASDTGFYVAFSDSYDLTEGTYTYDGTTYNLKDLTTSEIENDTDHILFEDYAYTYDTEAQSYLNGTSYQPYYEDVAYNVTLSFTEGGETEVYSDSVLTDSQFNEIELVSSTKGSDDETIYVIYIPSDGENYTNYITSLESASARGDGVVTASEFTMRVFDEGVEIKQVKSIGNTVIVNTTDGIYYFLWKNQQYKCIGDKVPQPQVTFKLIGQSIEQLNIGTLDFEYADTLFNTFRYRDGSMDNPTLSTAAVYVHENAIDNVENFMTAGYSKLKKKIEKNKNFHSPFFARVAVQLYDGSYIYASCPVIMYPTVNNNPFVKSWGSTDMYMHSASLYVEQTTDYSDYYDIVRDVSVFITRPVDIFEFAKPDNNDSLYADRIQSVKDNLYQVTGYNFNWEGGSHTDYQYRYVDAILSTVMSDSIDTDSQSGYCAYRERINLDTDVFGNSLATMQSTTQYFSTFFTRRTNSDIVEDLLDSCDNFYKLCDLGLDAFSGDVRSYYRDTILSTIEQQEQLSDGYYSYSKLTPDSIETYNRRLIMLNCTRSMFEGFSQFNVYENSDYADKKWIYKVKVSNEYGEYIVKKEVTSAEVFGSKFWFFYPDANAVSFEVCDEDGKIYLKAALKEHDHLNGAYYFDSYPDGGSSDLPSYTGDISTEETFTEEYPLYNYLIQSAVDNPLSVDASSYVRIGNGEMIGIAGLTTALNQDAYKVTTLLCFTTQGIWAVKESDEGVITSVAPPFSREVCIDSSTITMVDDGVFFVSSKGLMCVVATNENGVVCVSNQLRGNGKKEFLSFLDGCHIVYDYRAGHVIMYRTDTNKVWIYDLETKAFSTKTGLLAVNTTTSTIVDEETINTVTTEYPLPLTSVNNYPDYVIQDENYNLHSLYDTAEREDDEYTYSAELVSRPMKFQGSLYLKSLRSFRELLTTENSGASTVTILGSNDCKTWHALSSIYGKPWRFFKYSISFSNLTATDTFSGLVFDTEVRQNNKPH